MKNHALEVGATEFKAKCLDLIDQVHSRKRDSVVITKRGKPWAKLVPVEEDNFPLRGCMKGLMTIKGDITEPIDVEWEAMKD